jgi:WD40 repeat protein
MTRVILCTIIFLFISSLNAQEIDSLQFEKRVEMYESGLYVRNLDCWFNDTTQLIAYTRTGITDSLIVYDYAKEKRITSIGLGHWQTQIKFINSDLLLFHYGNDTMIYILNNFEDPQVQGWLYTSGDQEVIRKFTISKDKTKMALLTVVGTSFVTRWLDFFESSLSINPIKEFLNLPDFLPESEIAISDDLRFLAINGGYEVNEVTLINIESNSITQITTPENGGTYSPVFFTKDGALKLAVGSGYNGGTIQIIDVENKEFEEEIPVFTNYIYSLAPDTSGNFMACGGYDASIKLFASGTSDFNYIDTELSGLVNKLKFSTNNQYLLAGSGGGAGSFIDVFKVHFKSEENPSFIDTPESPEFYIYPNPSTNQLRINKPIEHARAEFYTSDGRFISSENISDETISISHLNPGVYFVKLFQDNTLISIEKLIKH